MESGSIGASTMWAYKMACTKVVMSKVRDKNVSIQIMYFVSLDK